MRPFSVIFVCKANLCRSPSAHGVFRRMVAAQGLQACIAIDSAGTHGRYAGKPPDQRSQEHAARRGYDLSDLRARHIQPQDFEQADLILVMDSENLGALQAVCPGAHIAKLRKLTEFCQARTDAEVRDPYAGDARDFDHVLDLLEDACAGLLGHVQRALAASRQGPGR